MRRRKLAERIPRTTLGQSVRLGGSRPLASDDSSTTRNAAHRAFGPHTPTPESIDPNCDRSSLLRAIETQNRIYHPKTA